jgi:hypothetical protein
VKSKKTTKVTLDSRRLLRVRLPEDAVMGWCHACGGDVRWVTVREAAAISYLVSRSGKFTGAWKQVRCTSWGLLALCWSASFL